MPPALRHLASIRAKVTGAWKAGRRKMKLAAAEALAALVIEPTAENVIPWSLDRDVPKAVAKATAEAW